MDILRNPPNPQRDAAIKARQDMAGKFGFVLGCISAVCAIALELYRTPEPYSILTLCTLVLMAALNLPIGIMLGLAGEKLTRPKKLRQR